MRSRVYNHIELGALVAPVHAVRRQVLEAVKLDFLIRLLRSPNPAAPQDPSLPPEAQNADVSAYQVRAPPLDHTVLIARA